MNGFVLDSIIALKSVGHTLSFGKFYVWQDPKIVGLNQVQKHTPLVLYDDPKDVNDGFFEHPILNSQNKRRSSLDSLGQSRTSTASPSNNASSYDGVLLPPKLVPNPARNMLLSSSNWKFRLFPSPVGLVSKHAPYHMGSNIADDSQWDTISVPSQWQLTKDYGKIDPPIYTNFRYPWKRSGNWSTSIPVKENPTGVYSLTFNLPSQEWSSNENDDIHLIFHGVGSSAQVFVDGTFVGYHQDSMTEAEFIITNALKPNVMEHKLCVVVTRWSDGSYLEDQDQWWLSGIHRDVVLQRRRRNIVLSDYFVVPTMDTLSIEAEIRHENPDEELKVRVSLFEQGTRTKPVLVQDSNNMHKANMRRHSHRFEKERIDSRHVGTCEINLTLENAKLWSPESPYLYTLQLELVKIPSGQIVQVELCKVGFRTVDITDGQLRVNQKPIIVCGANRHEFHQFNGKVLEEKDLVEDILIMKKHNFNAVRSCHYPNMHRWYELCDFYGLYVCDEANIETHGFVLGSAISLLQYDMRFQASFLTRAEALVLRTRNHPCVITWSLGNESGFGPNMLACSKMIRAMDPTRPVQYEGGIKSGDSPMLLGDGQDPVSDIVCPMYHTPLQINSYAQDPNEHRPIILCEYAHSMGNSTGGLALYWNLTHSDKKEHRQIQGGYIWDWVDQGIVMKDVEKNYFTAWGYGGDFGPTSGHEDAQFVANGMVFPDRTLHPVIKEAKFQQQPIGFDISSDHRTLLVKNRYIFSTLEHLNVTYELFDIKGLTKQVLFSGSAGEDFPYQLAPESSGEWSIPNVDHLIKSNNHRVVLRVSASLKTLTVWAKKNHEVAYCCFEICTPKPTPMMLDFSPNAVVVKKSEQDRILTISANGGYVVDFSLNKGTITGYKVNGREMLVEPLAHCFYRACTDNDLGGVETKVPTWLKSFVPMNHYSTAGRWKDAKLDSLNFLVISVTPDETNTTIVVESKAVGVKDLFLITTTFRFYSTHVQVSAKVRATKALKSFITTIPRVGIHLALAPELGNVIYNGRGPFENYPDRKGGAEFDIHETSVTSMHVPYVFPSECGGRSDVDWAALEDKKSKTGILFQYSNLDSGSGVPDHKVGDAETGKEIPSTRPAGMFHGMQFNASRFSLAQLDHARHQFELNVKDEADMNSRPVHVHLDTAHSGLGGDVSWLPSIHPMYMVAPSGEWNYKVDICPLQQQQQRS